MEPKSRSNKTAQLTFIGEVTSTSNETATITIFPEYCPGLKDIDCYSHLIILYWAHKRDNKQERTTLQVYPRRHGRKIETGVFSCRSPSRPNPICLCVTKLLKVEGCKLTVKNLDAEVNSPIIDIKPYHPHSDSIPNAKFPDWVKKIGSDPR